MTSLVRTARHSHAYTHMHWASISSPPFNLNGENGERQPDTDISPSPWPGIEILFWTNKEKFLSVFQQFVGLKTYFEVVQARVTCVRHLSAVRTGPALPWEEEQLGPEALAELKSLNCDSPWLMRAQCLSKFCPLHSQCCLSVDNWST